MSIISTERLAAIFVEVSDTLVAEFDLVDFLHMLTDRAADLVGAAAVGLLLKDERGRLEFMAGSNKRVAPVELFQLQNEQGPCLDAIRTRRPVFNVNLRGSTVRWPLFAPRAAAAGFQSVHAFPLRLREQVIGALNVFGDTKGGDFQDADVAIMQALADVATIALMQEREIHRGEVLAGQLQHALTSRVVIEQAKGVIAQVHGISVDEAFVVIRGYCRRTNRRLTDVARIVVDDLSRLPGLAAP